MTQPTLYPQLESSVAPLDTGPEYQDILGREKELVGALRKLAESGDLLEGVGDKAFLPGELIAKQDDPKPKVNPLERLPDDDVDDEEEPVDEEEEDEEQSEEEDDAGGDYLISHFDNGESYEDNDEDDDDASFRP